MEEWERGWSHGVNTKIWLVKGRYVTVVGGKGIRLPKEEGVVVRGT